MKFLVVVLIVAAFGVARVAAATNVVGKCLTLLGSFNLLLLVKDFLLKLVDREVC